nr:hypothetical protein [Streptomyces sp. TLI_235]
MSTPAENDAKPHRAKGLKDHAASIFKAEIPLLAALAGVSFVVVNSGYVYFYEQIGIRPEEVGFDRVGIASRTAAYIFVMVGVSVILIGGSAAIRWIDRKLRPTRRFEQGATAVGVATAASLSAFPALAPLSIALPGAVIIGRMVELWARRVKPIGQADPEQPEASETEADQANTEQSEASETEAGQAKTEQPKAIDGQAEPEQSEASETRNEQPSEPANNGPRMTAGMFFIVVAILLGGAIYAQTEIVESRIKSALDGNEVEPYSLFAYPIIDISAEPAHATWLDKESSPPGEFYDPRLLFLGRSASSVSFAACGHAVVVPALKVSVELREPIEPRSEIDGKPENLRGKFCECVRKAQAECQKILNPPTATPSGVATDPIVPGK